ncbi:MAG TPA: lactonase family protein [Candidatus Angelobacter sp.]|nr:lactonase family protein [Candidatus Angelobacter sp.]
MIAPALSRQLSCVVLLGLVLAASLACASDFSQTVFVGTYTDKESKGIYAFRFDSTSGETAPVELAAEAANPSFLAIGPGAHYLYAVNEVSNFEGDKTGAVSVFDVAGANGRLKLLQEVSSGGADPAHLSLDQSGRYLLVANYTGGNAAVFPIEKDGRLGARTAFVQNSGSSVNKERQAAPHAHEILVSRDNRLVMVPDLGTDELLLYRFDAASGALTPGKPASVKVAPGSGPRHFALAPSGKFLYLVNELASTVNVFSFDSTAGQLRELQTISTLPQGFEGQNTTAEIAVDAAGKHLYASNRGDDSIAVFAIDERTGKLTFVERVSTGGKEPRHFAFDLTGKWLFAANQNSGSINVFAVDRGSGRLSATSHSVAVAAPVCVLPVAMK